MYEVAVLLAVFFLKAVIIVAVILFLLIGIIAILSKGKESLQGRLVVKNLNKKYLETADNIYAEILPKDKYKQYQKNHKQSEKDKKKANEKCLDKNIFVIHFNGDIKASAVSALREEITAILNVAKTNDEVVILLESGGGMVHAYGLAAAQLTRLRHQQIPLTVIVDKVAASGGYLMASVANKILAAPFAIIGSIGVIVQLPNFNRWLKEKNIDFEQLTAGGFKRTLTMFGHNTEQGREKLQHEIEEIHTIFKTAIQSYRQQIDIDKVSTGEHWLGTKALEYALVDEIKTSDDYLLEKSKDHNIYEISYRTKKSFGHKLSGALNMFKQNFLESGYL